MGQRSGIAVSCGVGQRLGLDAVLLWLWCRLAAAALIRPLAWEFPQAIGVALKSKTNKKTPTIFINKTFFFVFLGLHLWHMEVPRVGSELELQLWAHVTTTAVQDPIQIYDLHHSSRQCQILNPLSKARDRTRIPMDTSWVCYC